MRDVQPVEEWRPIADWPDYAVSDFGRVKRIKKPYSGRGRVGAILKPRYSTGVQYPAVNLTRDRRPQHWFVHRLVAHVFLGPCPDGYEVNHRDGDKGNPRLSNLEYVTRSNNLRHAFENGMMSAQGEKNTRAILSDGDIRSIRAEYTGAYGQCAALARRYGVSHATMQDIVHRRHWTHVA